MEYIEKVKPFKDKVMLRYDNGDILIARKAALLTTKVTRMRRLNVQTLSGALEMIEISIKNDSLENSKRVDFEEPAIFSNTATINNLPKDIDNYLSAIEYLRAKHKRVLKPIEFIDFSN